MGKGDKYRPVDRGKWDKNYDRIFNKNKRQEKGTFIWDEKNMKFVPVSEYVKPTPESSDMPHFHIVGGTEASNWISQQKHLKNLQKDPLYTTLPEKQDKVQEWKDNKNETQAQLRQELNKDTRKAFDKHFLKDDN